MRVELPTVVSVCDWTGVSDRVAAAIASAAQNFGIITDDNKSMVIDKLKIRRERSKSLTKGTAINCSLVKKNTGLFFDGRKDNTIVQKKEGSSFTRKP